MVHESKSIILLPTESVTWIIIYNYLINIVYLSKYFTSSNAEYIKIQKITHCRSVKTYKESMQHNSTDAGNFVANDLRTLKKRIIAYFNNNNSDKSKQSVVFSTFYRIWFAYFLWFDFLKRYLLATISIKTFMALKNKSIFLRISFSVKSPKFKYTDRSLTLLYIFLMLINLRDINVWCRSGLDTELYQPIEMLEKE